MTFFYAHAAEESHVNTNAPAYRPRTTQARKFLKELYEKLDLPRPGDDIRQRFSHDARTTIAALTKLLLDPATTSTLQDILGRNVRADVAADCASVAKVAYAQGMPDAAEDLHKAALAGFEAVGNRKRQVEALKALAEFYDRANLSSKVAEMRNRIRHIGR